MHTSTSDALLNIVCEEFPTILQSADGVTTWRRRIHHKPSHDEVSIPIEHSSEVYNLSSDPQQRSDVLNKFLNILDVNLGAKYTKVSKTIYENDKSWKSNKLEEMLSPGLIYVSYWDEKYQEPLLFLSFMLTEGDGFIGTHSNDDDENEHNDQLMSVIYLYEIQILPQLRGQGIGTKLLSVHLHQCCSSLVTKYGKDFLPYPLVGIELTVFSDNIKAINFYKSIGMKLTPDSPTDEVYQIEKRQTRNLRRINNAGTREVTKQIIKKPVYYLYYLPIDL
ncbi:N-terminal L-serine N(alpha)-acetyltransferase NatD NDAI_0I02270 [Naumovozyma dairenensis CBS 421]|uniref:N-alpha-acetyltransferase 40 n=1 Tax=Naumovozyma dairenensis (strain ATCC 10597 / BCRC 20456 / CBS 421 / NBRC 0211 / NRRL Y-12639) TaxID=1071378 RepID=G0WG85_NAUDC|nr:hypothetical protein NDAI_0I02270 [Naumovozyma dairenensis CBS 421]CCD26796.1 hypothetical protein NDAI_0I02270 [Naumovozyma dairenensis CBS 421]